MPDITWFKDGDPLVPSSEVVYTRGGRQLQLERAQGSDAGTYSCKASNAVGVVEKTTRLEVYGERPGGAAGARLSWGERWEDSGPQWPPSGSKGGPGEWAEAQDNEIEQLSRGEGSSHPTSPG